MTTTAFHLIYECIGCTVEDPNTGLCYRVDDIMATKIGDYYEYHIGLQLLGQGETQPLLYVGVDRYDEMISYTPFDYPCDTPLGEEYYGG